MAPSMECRNNNNNNKNNNRTVGIISRKSSRTVSSSSTDHDRISDRHRSKQQMQQSRAQLLSKLVPSLIVKWTFVVGFIFIGSCYFMYSWLDDAYSMEWNNIVENSNVLVRQEFLPNSKEVINNQTNDKNIGTAISNSSSSISATKDTFSNDTLSLWDFSPHDPVVHVISTRFMQRQPTLLHLGLARLRIFKTFCLPTMISQTSQNFLWLIRTDPNLDPLLREELLSLMEGFPNFIVLPTNENPEGFREHDIDTNDVWSGSIELYKRFWAAAQTRIVLETRLDADDGLHVDFVNFIQHNAIEYVTEQTDWLVYCAHSHLEWHLSSPFPQITTQSDLGFLVGLRQHGCVTPGLTMVYGLSITRQELPKGTHHHLHQILPACSTGVKCLRRFEQLIPGAIRARTPTSAGMLNVVVGKWGKTHLYKRAKVQAKVQDKILQGVETFFQIDSAALQETKSYIVKNLQDIARDNLLGQCTKGHSCKSSSKGLLLEIMKS